MNAAVTADFDTLSQSAASAEAVGGHVPLNRLHPRVLGITLGLYVALIAAFTFGFSASVELSISLGIVFTIAAACAGVPWAMAVVAKRFWANHGQAEPRAGTFRAFMNGRFDTATGAVSGRDALALVITVPACLTLGVIAMAIIMRVA